MGDVVLILMQAILVLPNALKTDFKNASRGVDIYNTWQDLVFVVLFKWSNGAGVI